MGKSKKRESSSSSVTSSSSSSSDNAKAKSEESYKTDDSDEGPSCWQRFKLGAVGIKSPLSWFVFLSAFMVAGGSLFVSLCIVFDGLVSFPVYRANMGDLFEQISNDEGTVLNSRLEPPGLYWRKSAVHNGLPRYVTGTEPLECSTGGKKKGTPLTWKDLSPAQEKVKKFKLDFQGDCGVNPERFDQFKKTCVTGKKYTFEYIVDAGVNTDTRATARMGVYQNGNWHGEKCLRGDPMTFQTFEGNDALDSDKPLADIWDSSNLYVHFHVIDMQTKNAEVCQKCLEDDQGVLHEYNYEYEDRYQYLREHIAAWNKGGPSTEAEHEKQLKTRPDINMHWQVKVICHQPVDAFLVCGVISREIMNIVLCSLVLWYEAKEFWGGKRGVWYERVLVELARFFIFFFLGGVLLGEMAILGAGGNQGDFNWVLRCIGFYSLGLAFSHIMIIFYWKDSSNDNGDHGWAARFFGLPPSFVEANKVRVAANKQGWMAYLGLGGTEENEDESNEPVQDEEVLEPDDSDDSSDDEPSPRRSAPQQQQQRGPAQRSAAANRPSENMEEW